MCSLIIALVTWVPFIFMFCLNATLKSSFNICFIFTKMTWILYLVLFDSFSKMCDLFVRIKIHFSCIYAITVCAGISLFLMY